MIRARPVGLVLAVLGCVALALHPASAQDAYPSKPVKIVVARAPKVPTINDRCIRPGKKKPIRCPKR